MLSDRLTDLIRKIEVTKTLLKLPDLEHKAEELSLEMNRENFWSDQKRAQKISQDYQDITRELEQWATLTKDAKDLLELDAAKDTTLEAELERQTTELEKRFQTYELKVFLSGPYDQHSAIISVHAGSGGTEAQDWTAMLYRMLYRFAEKQGWSIRLLDESRGAEVGYKSLMFEVSGAFAYGYLKSEHGVHRLVRISPFDAEKMRHTTFALIEVLPELKDELENFKIDSKDLRIDTFMSGGKGGQSVNTTYSAVRIVHIPTGISVSCQNERSQLQNKETAMKILQAKLLRLEEEKRAAERQELRGEYKSAEWGNQIRSYVLHPYHLVKDHRTDFESTDPEGVLEGDLLPLSEAYLRWIRT
jgi:peptide chain release factor 2